MSRLSKQEPYRELNETSPSTAPSTTDELKQAFDTHKIPVADDFATLIDRANAGWKAVGSPEGGAIGTPGVGLECNASGLLAVKTGAGIDASSGSVAVKPGAGIDMSSGSVAVKPGAGIDMSSGSVAVKPGAGIDMSSGSVAVKPGAGIDVNANGVQVNLDQMSMHDLIRLAGKLATSLDVWKLERKHYSRDIWSSSRDLPFDFSKGEKVGYVAISSDVGPTQLDHGDAGGYTTLNVPMWWESEPFNAKLRAIRTASNEGPGRINAVGFASFPGRTNFSLEFHREDQSDDMYNGHYYGEFYLVLSRWAGSQGNDEALKLVKIDINFSL